MRRSTWEEESTDDIEKEKASVKVPVKQPETWGEIFVAWPKNTLCIVSNEFCERFSYYGMRTVLTLYLLNVLKFSDNISTVFFNGFTVLCYLTPLLGSIVADGYIGKFKTIFTVSILYAAGQVLLAFSSIKNSESPIHPWLDLAGLIIIGFGTGGIKPCVASFGGDQFEPGQEKMLSIFFSVFYFSINAGSMISTFISPMLRSKSCLGQDSCYPMAFGIPAVLMVVATVIFMLGSFSYKKPPPKDNVFGEIYHLITRSIRNKFSSSGQKRENLLDNFLNTHNCETDEKCLELRKTKKNKTVCQKVEFIDDVRQLLRIIVMFLPVPVFWALYDQQGSVWLIQAIQMDCRLWGSVLLLPDQMQTLNAVLILVFIPIFQAIIYPICEKVVKLTPLRKMIAGGVVAAGAFVISGFIQLKVNTTLAELPPSGRSYISIMNNLDCDVNVVGYNATVKRHSSITDDKYKDIHQTIKLDEGPIEFQFQYNCTAFPTPSNYPLSYTGYANSEKVYNLVLTELGAYMTEVKTDKPTEGTGEFSLSINLALNDTMYVGHLALCRHDKKHTDEKYPCDPTKPEDFYYYEVNYDDGNDNDLDDLIPYDSNQPNNYYASVYTFKPVRPGTWRIYYMKNLAKSVGMKSLSKEQVEIEPTRQGYTQNFTINTQGGVYVILLTGPKNNTELFTNRIVSDNVISILWQIPQIFTITVAEILFSITGYEFAYSQCAPSMKAVVQALWLLTTAIGDTIIVLIALADPFSNGATEAFTYAGSMLAVIGVFALLSIFYYEYHYYTGEEVDETGEYIDEDALSLANVKDGFQITNGTTNKGFDEISLNERF